MTWLWILKGCITVLLWTSRLFSLARSPSALFQPVLGASQRALGSIHRTGRTSVSIPKQRSAALGQLTEAIQLRSAAINEIDRETARKAIYNSCLSCYEAGVSRTEVHKIIRAITEEFKVGVS